MNPSFLEITARKRRDSVAIADPTGFEFGKRFSIDPQTVITNPLMQVNGQQKRRVS